MTEYSLLTTVERVRRRGAILTQDDDQLLTELIAEVSADAQDFMGRYVVSKARTESYRLRAFDHLIQLTGWPVTVVSSVKLDTRDDNWDNVTALSSELYVLDPDAGTIFLRGSVDHSPMWARVAYTGGLVSSSGNDPEGITKNFVASYPHVAAALDQEVIERNRRRKIAGAGQIATKGSMVQHSRPIGLLDDTRRRLGFLKAVRIN